MLTLLHFQFWLVTILCAGGGAYIGSYLKKKGEDIATHEDIKLLVAQMEATTEATKSIEARISSEVWDRQRHWEMKKEAVFSVVQALGKADDALLLYAAACFPAEAALLHSAVIYESIMSAETAWNKAIEDFERRRVMALLVCDNAFTDTLLEIRNVMRSAAFEMRKDDDAYDKAKEQLHVLIARVFAMCRCELGTEKKKADE
jgi:hypothetical protein